MGRIEYARGFKNKSLHRGIPDAKGKDTRTDEERALLQQEIMKIIKLWDKKKLQMKTFPSDAYTNLAYTLLVDTSDPVSMTEGWGFLNQVLNINEEYEPAILLKASLLLQVTYGSVYGSVSDGLSLPPPAGWKNRGRSGSYWNVPEWWERKGQTLT